MQVPILGMNIDELTRIVLELSFKREHAQELSKWIYRKDVTNFDNIVSIPISLRNSLNNKYCIGNYPLALTSESTDGTCKYLFENSRGLQFESVYMPSLKRNTLCISTQSGCRMGCGFCLTGKIGFKGNLMAIDIVNQYLSAPERKKINRIVIMGMGEPFDNFSEVKKAVEIITAEWGAAFGASNITLSSVGLHDPLREFLDNPFCNLAISLNNPLGEERKELMPIEVSNPIAEAVNLIKSKPVKKPLRLSFEYVALSGINTDERHARAIAELLDGLKYHLNIICWNSHNSSIFKTPSELELNAFVHCLNSSGVLTSIRQSRGQDIGAACGQMIGKANR
jgi:23S rRNA (adenine2503-C2)-methyltransferase